MVVWHGQAVLGRGECGNGRPYRVRMALSYVSHLSKRVYRF